MRNKYVSVKHFVFLTVFTSSISFAEPSQMEIQKVNSANLPTSVASLGDSISAGVLASYSRVNLANPVVVLHVVYDLLKALLSKTIAPVEKRYLSWSTGIDPHRRLNSHAYRLRELNPALQIYNPAISGATAEDVWAKEIPTLNAWSRSNLKKEYPDYVTLLIGANDICGKNMDDMTDPGLFKEKVDQVLGEILSRQKTTKILVGDIPALEKLHDNYESSLLSFRPFQRCGDLWHRARMCRNLLENVSPENAVYISQRVRLLNQILEQSVDSYRAQYGDRVRFAPALYQSGVNPNDLAVDCFHPNIEGQKAIANNTWEQSWWSGFWKVDQNPDKYSEKVYRVDPEWNDR